VNGDGKVTISEIITVVNGALNGCPAGPSPTPAPACAERFCDNGDGTITDNQTGLMWEKKVSLDDAPGGLHDADNHYVWAGLCITNEGAGPYCQATADAAAACSAHVDGTATACGQCTGTGTCLEPGTNLPALTIWDWITQLNGGAGFAGHTDWRVPKISEIVAINESPAFNLKDCSMGCTDILSPTCSCTGELWYWSATAMGTEATTTDGIAVGDTLVRSVRAVRNLP
jgi:hypothetical protein